MENLFKRKYMYGIEVGYTHEEVVDMIFDNQLILSEIELELVTLWFELGRYNDEEWEEIGEGGKNNVRKVRIDLPKVGETLIRNKLEKDNYTIKKLGQIIEKMTGLYVKDICQDNDEEFDVEFLDPIPRLHIN